MVRRHGTSVSRPQWAAAPSLRLIQTSGIPSGATRSAIVNLAQRGELIHRAVSSIVVKRVVELLLLKVGLFDAPSTVLQMARFGGTFRRLEWKQPSERKVKR